MYSDNIRLERKTIVKFDEIEKQYQLLLWKTLYRWQKVERQKNVQINQFS